MRRGGSDVRRGGSDVRRGGSDVRRGENEGEEEVRRKGVRRHTPSSTQLVEQRNVLP